MKRGTRLLLLEACPRCEGTGVLGLSLRCGACRAHVPLGANFCPGCGARTDWSELVKGPPADAKGHR
jgi:predicted amidophosphoribosyltransferase